MTTVNKIYPTTYDHLSVDFSNTAISTSDKMLLIKNEPIKERATLTSSDHINEHNGGLIPKQHSHDQNGENIGTYRTVAINPEQTTLMCICVDRKKH